MDPSTEPWPRRVAILGVGLLGGSLGLALRRAVPEIEIVGTSRNAHRRALAIDRGAVTEATESVAEACRECDVVVVCSPVDRIAAMVIEAADHAAADCLITDVGSTKKGIVEAVARQPAAMNRFVAAHPIAGSEKTGVENASASLFDGRVIILTPQDQEESWRTTAAECFWRLTGGRIVTMSPQDHDAHLASVSHVPHLMSALVAKMASPEARGLVGTGWRDITRVAAGDPTLWTAITSENRVAISTELAKLAAAVDELRKKIDGGSEDELFRWLTEAKEIKEQTL